MVRNAGLWVMGMLSWVRGRVLDLFSRKNVGRRGERLACRFLRRRGLRVLARNVRAGRGEIDIIALDGQSLVFVEVKSRRSPARAEETGLERMDERKSRALRQSCLRYARGMSAAAENCRIDVVTVKLDRRGRAVDIRWYPGYVEF